MQYVVLNRPSARAIVKQDADGHVLGSIRICTEEQIQNMSAGSLWTYRRKVLAWTDDVHEHGTPDAVRAIDYLLGAFRRAKERNTGV